jgi:hypothetical protein
MAIETCPFCDAPLSSDDQRAMEACGSCASRIGIIRMPPSRRPPLPCGRCNGRRFVRAIPREHTTDRAGDSNVQISAPMYVTYTPTSHRGWILKHVKSIEVETPGHGLLETYICKKCGFVEWYCADVERIPIHPNLMTEDIDYEGETPYR